MFLYHTVHFLWGDHDFVWIYSGLSWKTLWALGRFTAVVIPQIFGGQLLPIINNVVYFTGLAFSAVALAIYWQLPRKFYIFILLALFLVLQPYTLSWLFYAHVTMNFG